MSLFVFTGPAQRGGGSFPFQRRSTVHISAPALGSVGLGVVVGVGGLHDLEVAPVGPGQVAELDQVGLMVDHVVTVGRAAQHVVDDGGLPMAKSP